MNSSHGASEVGMDALHKVLLSEGPPGRKKLEEPPLPPPELPPSDEENGEAGGIELGNPASSSAGTSGPKKDDELPSGVKCQAKGRLDVWGVWLHE